MSLFFISNGVYLYYHYFPLVNPARCWSSLFYFTFKNKLWWGVWVAQSVKHLLSAQVMILGGGSLLLLLLSEGSLLLCFLLLLPLLVLSYSLINQSFLKRINLVNSLIIKCLFHNLLFSALLFFFPFIFLVLSSIFSFCPFILNLHISF